MESRKGSELVKDWPEESREAAQLVLDTYGEPHEATGSLLTLAPRSGETVRVSTGDRIPTCPSYGGGYGRRTDEPGSRG